MSEKCLSVVVDAIDIGDLQSNANTAPFKVPEGFDVTIGFEWNSVAKIQAGSTLKLDSPGDKYHNETLRVVEIGDDGSLLLEHIPQADKK
jgi:hypothetical protein